MSIVSAHETYQFKEDDQHYCQRSHPFQLQEESKNLVCMSDVVRSLPFWQFMQDNI